MSASRSSPMERTPRRVTLRTVAILWAVLSLLLVVACSLELSTLGFRDGYISPYDRSTMGLLKIFVWAGGLQGVCFLLIGMLSRRVTALSLALGIAAAAILIVAPMFTIQYCPDIPACRSAYERITRTQMDDGEGG